MKLSELRPCDGCGGKLLADHCATFYVITSTQAMVSARAANEVLGMTQFFQGNLALAEVMGPRPDEAVMVFGEKDPNLLTKILLCFDCYCSKPLAQLEERRNAQLSESGAQEGA